MTQNNFTTGDSIKVKDKAWDEFISELSRFGFEKGKAYEVSGVYREGAVISIKGGYSTYHSEYFELAKSEVTVVPEVKSDAVNKPKHYSVFEQLEAIEVIASSMTTEQFYGYCLGNILKYRLRAGGKDDVMQELGKADRYQGLYNEFKHLCKAA